MKKVILLTGLMMALLTVTVTAQQDHGICGVHEADGQLIKERLLKNRKDMADFVYQRGAVTYVPVKIHLVAESNGTKRLSETKALDMLCILNEEYESLEIQFYLKDGFKYMNNTLVANHNNYDSNPAGVWTPASNTKDNSALNIFVTSKVGGSGGTGITLAYYTPLIDCIFIRQASIYGRNVLPHEVGHFFSLNHPFFGWESQPWDEATHGIQVGNNGPDGQPNERVAQSGATANCATAADGICDTAPDYLFGFNSAQSGCNPFAEGTMDPDGVVIDPLEDNTMSYFSGCDPYLMTDDQITAIHMDLASPARAYVNPGITPNLDELGGLAVLSAPIDEEVRPYNAVFLEWEAVAGATHYVIEIDRSNGFNLNPIRKIVDNNSNFIGNALLANSTYYWRVRPFNEYRTCSDGVAEIGVFKTNNVVSAVAEIDGVDHWAVRPNPVTAKEMLYLDIQTSRSFEGTVNVYSVTGTLVGSSQKQFARGASTVELSTANFTKGMYLVSVQTENGVMTKRVVVQ